MFEVHMRVHIENKAKLYFQETPSSRNCMNISICIEGEIAIKKVHFNERPVRTLQGSKPLQHIRKYNEAMTTI
jgi:hypothetical protein